MNGLEERWKAGVVKWIFRERGKEEEEGGRQQYEMGDLMGKGGGRGGAERRSVCRAQKYQRETQRQIVPSPLLGICLYTPPQAHSTAKLMALCGRSQRTPSPLLP